MKFQKQNTIPIIMIIISIFTLFMSGCQRNDAVFKTETRVAEILPTFTPHPTSTPQISAEILRKYTASAVETEYVNGVEMSISSFHIKDEYLTVNICYQLPDEKNWTIGEAVIQIKEKEAPLFRATALEINKALGNGQSENTSFSRTNTNTISVSILTTNNMPNYRCDVLGFRVDELELPDNISLVIKYINAFPDEGDDCMEYRDAVYDILQSKGLDIKIDCNDTGEKSEIVITEKSDSISQEDAEKLVSSAFQESFTRIGPWVFKGEINK
jgi:hypothetical protein